MLGHVADWLARECGYPDNAEVPGANPRLDSKQAAMWGAGDAEDDLLVAKLRRALAIVAAGAPGAEEARTDQVNATLDGTELVMRGEILRDAGAQLCALFPGFVFLVALPVAGEDQALELLQRTTAQLEKALADDPAQEGER